ncbi:uncharacterized protein JCM15063_004515 [Sporobolomyces koalae]|uniref:uncharacterized protein n=1 Tax=Sporobolomyces koalae TaxID=500713 RepID=UPI0031825715
MLIWILALPLVGALASSQSLDAKSLVKDVPALPLGLYRHLRASEAEVARAQELDLTTQATQQIPFLSPSPSSSSSFPPHFFDQLVSHDPDVPSAGHASTDDSHNSTFKQRYWFDASYYKKGGPVFLLDAGETNAEGRIPFLEKGILKILSEATGGIGIVFEHRYYGESFPVKKLTTDSYRFLTALQSIQDSNYFAENVVLPGFEHLDLSPKKTAWIRYGGSYAGATSALARKLYPEFWWGAIASSAVTTAIVDYWQYYKPIQAHAPPECISQLENHTAAIDSILALKSSLLTSSLKTYFGLPNVTKDEDFVNALSMPLGSWQARNWDPRVGSKTFYRFCDALTNNASASGQIEEEMSLPKWPSNPRKQLAAFANYANYVKEHIASRCPEGVAQDDCFGTDLYDGDGLEEAPWKSWSYQFCTEWGYFMGGAPKGQPTIVSRLITPEYTGQICKQAFPPGKLNAVPVTPNVTRINQYGSFDLSYPRLAFIDGSADPWIYATPHSPEAKSRKDTIRKPFKIIPEGVHHWDENGLTDPEQEPKEIHKIHQEEIAFVRQWLREWRGRGKWKMDSWTRDD